MNWGEGWRRIRIVAAAFYGVYGLFITAALVSRAGSTQNMLVAVSLCAFFFTVGLVGLWLGGLVVEWVARGFARESE